MPCFDSFVAAFILIQSAQFVWLMWQEKSRDDRLEDKLKVVDRWLDDARRQMDRLRILVEECMLNGSEAPPDVRVDPSSSAPPTEAAPEQSKAKAE